MKNIAKSRVKSILQASIQKITPYPVPFTLSSQSDPSEPHDYTTNLPSDLHTSFSQLSAYMNTSSPSMLFDELYAASMPNDHVKSIDYRYGSVDVAMRDLWWMQVWRDGCAGDDLTDILDGDEVIVDISQVIDDRWTDVRRCAYLEGVRKVGGAGVVDFRLQSKTVGGLDEITMFRLLNEEVASRPQECGDLKDELDSILDPKKERRPITHLRALMCITYLKPHISKASNQQFKS